MRRFVHSLAIVGAAALAACSGGGSVLSFDQGGNGDRVLVSVVGPSNIARVIPGAALALSATSLRGGQNGAVANDKFKWSAVLVTAGQYVRNSTGTTAPCNPAVFNPTPIPPATTAAAIPYQADFGIYIAIDPVNESNILFIPPVLIPVPGPAAPAPGSGTLTTTYPYCVVVTATAPGGAAGSITVAVVNPAAPLN